MDASQGFADLERKDKKDLISVKDLYLKNLEKSSGAEHPRVLAPKP